MPKECNGKDLQNHPRNNRKILVIGINGVFSSNAVNHSVHLAERVRYDLVALSVDLSCEGLAFEKRACESSAVLRSEALLKGIHCDHMVRSGDLDLVIGDFIREIKRVELVVIDSEAAVEMVRDISVPVVSVMSDSNSKGVRAMSGEHGSSKAGTIGRTVGYGLLSAACYAAVFTHADAAMRYFTQGGWYAALPITTVLVFSFVHGAFAHNLWSMLGIEAHQRNRVRQTERKVIEKRKQLSKRPRLYAYVNPFHRIDR